MSICHTIIWFKGGFNFETQKIHDNPASDLNHPFFNFGYCQGLLFVASLLCLPQCSSQFLWIIAIGHPTWTSDGRLSGKLLGKPGPKSGPSMFYDSKLRTSNYKSMVVLQVDYVDYVDYVVLKLVLSCKAWHFDDFESPNPHWPNWPPSSHQPDVPSRRKFRAKRRTRTKKVPADLGMSRSTSDAVTLAARPG